MKPIKLFCEIHDFIHDHFGGIIEAISITLYGYLLYFKIFVGHIPLFEFSHNFIILLGGVLYAARLFVLLLKEWSAYKTKEQELKKAEQEHITAQEERAIKENARIFQEEVFREANKN